MTCPCREAYEKATKAMIAAGYQQVTTDSECDDRDMPIVYKAMLAAREEK